MELRKMMNAYIGEKDSIDHTFRDCHFVKIFIQRVINWLNIQNKIKLNPSSEERLVGIILDLHEKVLVKKFNYTMLFMHEVLHLHQQTKTNQFSSKTSLMKWKLITESSLRSSVVYKFSCASCNACYVGETRHFSTRHFSTHVRQQLGTDRVSHVYNGKLKLWIYEIHIFELRNEEINVKKILAVIKATYAVAKRKPEKIRPAGFEPCDTGAVL